MYSDISYAIGRNFNYLVSGIFFLGLSGIII